MGPSPTPYGLVYSSSSPCRRGSSDGSHLLALGELGLERLPPLITILVLLF